MTKKSEAAEKLSLHCNDLECTERFDLTSNSPTRIITSMKTTRNRLLHQLLKAAEIMLQGSISETTRTCGYPGCRCHSGQRHGPHTYLTFKTAEGRSSSVYVPVAARAEAEAGVEGWRQFWKVAVQLAADNRERAVGRWRSARAAGRVHDTARR
jgi:hypothetical protein